MKKPKTFKQVMSRIVHQGQIISGSEEEYNDMEMEIHDLKIENARLRDSLATYTQWVADLQAIIGRLKG